MSIFDPHVKVEDLRLGFVSTNFLTQIDSLDNLIKSVKNHYPTRMFAVNPAERFLYGLYDTIFESKIYYQIVKQVFA